MNMEAEKVQTLATGTILFTTKRNIALFVLKIKCCHFTVPINSYIG